MLEFLTFSFSSSPDMEIDCMSSTAKPNVLSKNMEKYSAKITEDENLLKQLYHWRLLDIRWIYLYSPDCSRYISYGTSEENLSKYQDILSLVIVAFQFSSL